MNDDEDLTVDAITRRLNANQPHPAELVVDALERTADRPVVEQAAAVLAVLQRHYELRPR